MNSDLLIQSEDEPAAVSDKSLPPPPVARRRLTLFSLVAITLSSWWVALALLPAARFSLAEGEPQDLGPLAAADLEHAQQWVKGTARTTSKALAFKRRGEHGSFRLTRASEREDLWLLLRVPETVETNNELYVPPARFTGRLLALSDAGLQYSPIRQMIEDEGAQSEGSFLLLDGELPSTHRDSLWAALLLALLGALCLGFALRLKSPLALPLKNS